jgi:hypothetical protein
MKLQTERRRRKRKAQDNMGRRIRQRWNRPEGLILDEEEEEEDGFSAGQFENIWNI